MKNTLTFVIDSMPLLLQGALMTLKLWLASGVISLSLGTIFGVLRCQKLRFPGLSFVFDGITFVLRGIPFYVQLLIAYFVLPELLGISLSPFIAATGSLGLCSAAFVSQMVRSGINSIPNGQWEAASALGYTTLQALRYIILPQMVRNVLPAITGELDQLLKSTAIISSIGVLELTRSGMNIVAREINPVTTYLVIAGMYLVISSALNATSSKIERGLCYANS